VDLPPWLSIPAAGIGAFQIVPSRSCRWPARRSSGGNRVSARGRNAKRWPKSTESEETASSFLAALAAAPFFFGVTVSSETASVVFLRAALVPEASEVLPTE
jgi:hypothetical protein